MILTDERSWSFMILLPPPLISKPLPRAQELTFLSIVIILIFLLFTIVSF